MAAETRGTGGGYDLEEIRRRADLVEIISAHVALRKAGRRLQGLCPFHQERTPSFTVDPEAGLWHCFGCKAGGDLFRFVEMSEKVTFAEAVEMLGRRLGVAPRRGESSRGSRERERLLEIHQLACSFFQAQLRADIGKPAGAYLAHRGVSPESIESFAIGYAPDSWDSLLQALGKRACSGQELARAGLAVAREGGGFYDRFRDRLLFPIRDSGGRVIAFGGRALRDEQTPKYLNSPESSLFQKGQTLYAFDRARRAMGEAGRAIVVEGYLDAISCHEAGLAETVATMGTALTAEHVELLRRRVSRLVLAFDADSAGLAAALRGRELFEQAGLSIRVVTLPEGMDPDRVIREQGPEAFGGLVAEAVPMIEWELSRILSPPTAGGAARVDVMREAVATLARLPTGVEREYYTRWLVEKWGPDSAPHGMNLEAAVRQELAEVTARRGGRGRRTEQQPAAGAVKKQPVAKAPGSRIGADLLAALISHGELAARYMPSLEAEDFASEQRDIFVALRSLIDRNESVSGQAVLAAVEPGAREALAELLLGELPGERLEESVASGVARLVEGRLLRQEAGLRQRLDRAESPQERESILRELTELRRQLSHLAGQRLIGDD